MQTLQGMTQLTSLFLDGGGYFERALWGWEHPVLLEAIGSLPRLRELVIPYTSVRLLARVFSKAIQQIDTLHLIGDYHPFPTLR